MAISLTHYRFGINELAENTHGWHAAEDANPASGAIALDTNFLLRFCTQCDATGLSNVDNEFQYRRNGGTWTNITTSSTFVRAVAVTPLTNGSNCTKRLSGTGTFESSGAGQTEDGTSGGTANDIVASGNSETECGLVLRSADIVGGDVIEFRLTRDGGTLLDTYSVVPTLLIPTNGSTTKTLGALTSSATGKVDVVGSTTQTLGALTSAASGTVDVTGATAQTLGALTLEADGTTGIPEILGTLSLTLDDLTVDAAATSDIAGALSLTLGAVTSAAAGTVAIVGAAAVTLGTLTSAATGKVDVSGAFSQVLGALTLAAAGKVDIAAALAKTLDELSCAASGTVGDLPVLGELNAALDALTATATGEVTGSPGLPTITAHLYEVQPHHVATGKQSQPHTHFHWKRDTKYWRRRMGVR